MPSAAPTISPGWVILCIASLGVVPLAAAEPASTGSEPDVGAANATDLAPVVPAPESDCPPSQRFVILLADPGLDPAFVSEIRADMTAELAPQGVLVCSDEGARDRAEAVVRLSPIAPQRISIEVDSDLTDRRVARDLSLEALPVQGRALAVAIAIDELLRASWAEFSVARRSLSRPSPQAQPTAPPLPRPPGAGPSPTPAPERPAPSRRRRARDRPSRARRPSGESAAVTLGITSGYHLGPEHWNAFTWSLRADLQLLRWGWMEAQLGALWAIPVESALGTVTAAGLAANLTGGACTARGRPLALCGGARGELWWLRLAGRDGRDAIGKAGTSPALILSGVAALRAELTRKLRGVAAISLGGVAHSVQASAGSSTLMGVTRFVASAQIGLGWAL